ncbi:dethiobiotin synthase [Arthrobacter sp. BF1]|uniref:dethiobiotin synthase n=1 Tax=Arthrobacter sp. BF1 TaxID=2821145 RepID=UPI001C4F3D2B|nr:dethiobiotin synthase [Arthrobacter sp. BF1]
MNQPTIIFVTGTDTGVGKTVTTAALAASFAAAGATVAVYKPTQTGISGEEAGDMDEVRRLSGIRSVTEGIRLAAPMAPVAAAELENRKLPSLTQHANNISELLGSHGVVLVEGAGGLLVEMDERGHTLADLAGSVKELARVLIVVVCRSGLGTLNHTQLTLEALVHRGLPAAGLVIGSWPESPTDLERGNLRYLNSLRVPWLGSLPAGASWLAPDTFRERMPHYLHLPRTWLET